jgi:hypothetical protein
MAVTAKLDKETAKLRQVKEATENTFNIVSHQGPPRRIETMLAAQKTKGMPPRPYNFVTNLTVEDHQNAPLLFDEAYTNARAGKPKEVRSAVGKHNRDFSIVNNEFYEHHDSKKKAEYQKFKEHTLERYWATHDYDPVRGKFYNAEKEERFREQRQILSQVHGMSKSLRVAPSIQYSEGSCYDIVNHAIHDDGKCTASDAVADRSLHRMKRVEKEKQAREEGEVRHSAEEQKRLARVSYKRWEEGIDRGYDFIKNAVAPVDQPMPLPTRPTTMWARLQTTAEMNADNGRYGLSGANTANSVRGSTAAAPVAQTTGRIRNLSGVGPQYAELRVNLPTSDTFPDSPGTYMSTDAGFTGRNSSYSPAPAAPQQQAQSVRLKPMTAAAADHSAVQNGGLNGSARGSRAATAKPTSGANREGVRSRVGAVPSLDLTKAEAPEPVRYVEPSHGPMGLSVAMVRTGGLGGYRE